jgi:hypothetical protein
MRVCGRSPPSALAGRSDSGRSEMLARGTAVDPYDQGRHGPTNFNDQRKP